MVLRFVPSVRRFIDAFKSISYPLNKLVKKGAPDPLTFDVKQRNLFDGFIDQFYSPPGLALPRANLPYCLECDVINYEIVCALFQMHPDGERKTIGFWCRSLLFEEENYSASEWGFIVVFWELKTRRPYLINENVYEKMFVAVSSLSSCIWVMYAVDFGQGHLQIGYGTWP